MECEHSQLLQNLEITKRQATVECESWASREKALYLTLERTRSREKQLNEVSYNNINTPQDLPMQQKVEQLTLQIKRWQSNVQDCERTRDSARSELLKMREHYLMLCEDIESQVARKTVLVDENNRLELQIQAMREDLKQAIKLHAKSAASEVRCTQTNYTRFQWPEQKELQESVGKIQRIKNRLRLKCFGLELARQRISYLERTYEPVRDTMLLIVR
jgi:hypothetical protein